MSFMKIAAQQAERAQRATPAPPSEVKEPVAETEAARIFKARLAAAQARHGVQSSAVPEAEVSPEDIPDLGDDEKPLYDNSLRDYIKELDVVAVIQRFTVKDPKPTAAKMVDGNKFRCPWPEHPDVRPDAWFHRDKRTWFCGPCGAGGDNIELIAAARGYTRSGHTIGQNPELYSRLMDELKGELGWVDPAPVLAVVAEPPETAGDPPSVPATGTTGVGGTSGPVPAPLAGTATPETQNATGEEEHEDETGWPTYDLAQVLPGKQTFLDAFCAEGLKADVPREFPLWAGISALSVAIGRRVALKKIERPTYGNFSICLTCQSTSGKGRSLDWAEDILRAALPYDETPLLSGLPPEGVRVIDLPGSGEALVDDLDVVLTDTGGKVIKRFSPAALVRWSEMSYVVGKSRNSSYKTYVIDFADTRPIIARNSLRNGRGQVKNGFVTFLTSTQPGALRDQFGRGDVSSGLLNRFLFPFGKTVPPRAWGTPEQDWVPAEMALRGIDLWASNLTPNNPDGNGYWISEADWKDDARELWIELFGTRVVPDKMGPQSDLLGRMDLNMLRLVLLFAVNERSIHIEANHVRQAFALYDYLKACALSLAREVASTELSDHMKLVLDAVRKVETTKKTPATRRDLDRASAKIKAMNEEQFTNAVNRLQNAKRLFHVEWRGGRGKPGNGYTTDRKQWEKAPLTVTQVKSSTV